MSQTPPPPEEEKGHKGYRLTALERTKRKHSDMSNWRKRIQAAKTSFDDRQKGIYLNVLSKTGRKQQACSAAGTSRETVARHREQDPEFSTAEDEALAIWADTVHTLAVKLMNGVKKPIIGGKDKNEIVAHEIVHATNILAMEMKRTNPDYKERSEIDLNNNHSGGVMLVPETATSVEDFLKQEAERTSHKPMPGADEEKAK